jgi:transcription elongation GreA/GreB family factor
MSKAFTKDDEAAGFDAPSSSTTAIPSGAFRVTASGARALQASDDPRVVEAVSRAEVLAPQPDPPERAALGVTVHVRTESDEERTYRLVTAEEYALLGDGCSIGSPLGRALLGAQVGEVRELRAPRGKTELEVVALDGER